MKFKRVLWVSDRSYPEYNGGAERTDYVIREAGKKLGLEIDWNNDLPPKTSEYDLVVVSNIHLWPDIKAQQLLLELFNPLVFFSHDPIIHSWYPTAISQAFVSVFMSPAHRDFYTKKFYIKNSIVQPHGISEEDLNRWTPKAPKKDYYLYIGDLNEYKGVQNVYKWAESNPTKEVKLWGRNWAKFPFLLNNFKWYGFLDEDKLARTLAEAKYFIHLPELIDPCPRMVTFALLSGCTIIGNENIGLATYDWPWKDPERLKAILRKEPTEFWYRVNKFYRRS